MKKLKKHISVLDGASKSNSRLNDLFIIRIILIKLIRTLVIYFLAQRINVGGSMIINMEFIWVERAMASCN